MADKVKRTPAKLSKLVEDFDMEIQSLTER